MKSKIVIYDDSVILYENYINGNKWEHVHGYARNGLTYLIQNNAIKFYIAPDYFYKNIIASMELPLHITDEAMGIDGDYDDIDELTEILDRIFLQYNEEGIDLSLYLKKLEAEELYQPIGDYLTKDEAEETYQPIGDYLTPDDLSILDDYLTKEEAEETYQPLGDYLTKESGDTIYQPIGDYLTKASGDTIYQPIGDYLTKVSGDTIYQPIGDYLTKASGDTIYQPIGDYQPAGDYALKSDIPSLDGYATQTWVQNQGYVNQLKTINNISLIGEGNIQIGSGGTIDAYTKAESDERFQPKGDYVSNSTFIQYITNLTQQITSLQEAIENCCTGQTGETLYRWITLTGDDDYICSGTTKYAKEQKQQSTDNGATWTNVSPAEYRTGTLIETNSPDCGYEPVIEYRWVTVQGDYVCSGTTKYNKEKQQYRVDGGAWIDTDPLQTRRGSTVIEYNSQDCGYIPPQYRWYQAPASDYICSGTSKYYKEYYQVSNDGGVTWTNVSPTQTRTGALIETQSVDCGYVPPQYRWRDTTATTCSNYDKCFVARQQVSYDGGQTWQNTSTTGIGTTIEVNSYDCGYTGTPKVKNTTSEGHVYQVNCNNSPILTQAEINRCKDAYLEECTARWEIGNCVTHIGSGSTAARFGTKCTTAITIGNSVQYIGTHTFENCSGIAGITIPNSVTTIESDAFRGCSGLTSIDIPSSVTYLGTACFSGCTSLQTIIVRATTPPTLGGIGVFENGNGCPIKVPASAVNTYKTAWPDYASRIQAIS